MQSRPRAFIFSQTSLTQISGVSSLELGNSHMLFFTSIFSIADGHSLFRAVSRLHRLSHCPKGVNDFGVNGLNQIRT